MTVLVTGGSGLVGSHVIELLHGRGERVRALVRSGAIHTVARLGAEPVVGDVTDGTAWRHAARDVRAIVHAAALVGQRDSYDRFYAVNVEAVRLAVEAARASGALLVHLSSVAVYGRALGDATPGAAVTEESPFRPLSPDDFYARTKRLADELVRAEAGRGGLDAVVLRPDVVYGERDRLFTPKLIGVVRWGMVPVVGTGRNQLACVYVGNVASAVLAALDHPREGFHAYNVTEDAPPALNQHEFLTTFAEALGLRPRLVRVPPQVARLGARVWILGRWLRNPRGYAGIGRSAVAFLTNDNPYSIARARAELEWEPPWTTKAAVTRTVRWYRHGRGAG